MIIEKQNSTIELLDDCVVKTLKNRKKSYEWYEAYKKFSHGKDRYVKILEFEPTRLVMEKIKIWHPVNYYLKKLTHDRQLNLQIAKTYTTVILDCFNFNTNDRYKYWAHDDLTIDNFVITKDKNIILMDPDSFHFTKYMIDYKYSFGYIELQNLITRNEYEK